MGPCCEDPHLRWASWLLGLAELAGVLLGACGTGPLSSGSADSRAHVSLKRVQGGTVLFHVTWELEGDTEAQLEEMEWGFGPETNYRVLLRVGSGGDLPTWVSLQDKYGHRVHVPNMTSLLIANLTREDSGQYRAQPSFTGGRRFIRVFQLTVYKPVPLPQILPKSLSITADWCNVTLECNVTMRASEDLNVTWWHSDLPRKWQQTGTLGPVPSVWPLAVRLPLDQANTNLTCAASNQEDLKIATTTLRNVCAQERLGVTPNSCLHLNVSHHRALLCTLAPADPGGSLPPTPPPPSPRAVFWTQNLDGVISCVVCGIGLQGLPEGFLGGTPPPPVCLTSHPTHPTLPDASTTHPATRILQFLSYFIKGFPTGTADFVIM
ncbi:uncharacterized protein RBU33_011727 isoform 1-T1 [Hipposideros larvatus]